MEGGAIFLASGSLTISDESSIINATTASNGVLYINDGTALVTNASLIYRPRLRRSGGAVYQRGGTLTVTNRSAIVNATSESTIGGAIYLESGTFTLANNSLIANSTVWGQGSAIANYGGVAIISDSRISRSFARLHTCLLLQSGETHLINATIDGCESSNSDGRIMLVPSAALNPLFAATKSAFYTHACADAVFSQQAPAQILLRNITFTPLAKCSAASLASSFAFSNVTTKRCGELYTTTETAAQSVCSSTAPG
eukprot:4648967-Prymnesium_polylepis.1